MARVLARPLDIPGISYSLEPVHRHVYSLLDPVLRSFEYVRATYPPAWLAAVPLDKRRSNALKPLPMPGSPFPLEQWPLEITNWRFPRMDEYTDELLGPMGSKPVRRRADAAPKERTVLYEQVSRWKPMMPDSELGVLPAGWRPQPFQEPSACCKCAHAVRLEAYVLPYQTQSTSRSSLLHTPLHALTSSHKKTE